jgi:hypothetical protein
MRITLEELLHAINIIGEERGVYVEGRKIVVRPPVQLTPAGKEHYKNALSATVAVQHLSEPRITIFSVSDDAVYFLYALIHFSYETAKWFRGEDAQLV